MPAYPLIFKFTEIVQGGSFLARVVGTGRVLMLVEDDDWWCHGVEPGALSQNGMNPVEAYQRFRIGLRWVLEDFAKETKSFEDFVTRVRRFFAARDDHEARRWQSAVEELRRGAARLEAPFDTLPRVKAEQPSDVNVEVLQALKRFTTVEETIALAQAA